MNFTFQVMTSGTLGNRHGGIFGSVILDTIQQAIRPLGSKHARIGRVREADVPYAPSE
jgi:hypothetical protein